MDCRTSGVRPRACALRLTSCMIFWSVLPGRAASCKRRLTNKSSLRRSVAEAERYNSATSESTDTVIWSAILCGSPVETSILELAPARALRPRLRWGPEYPEWCYSGFEITSQVTSSKSVAPRGDSEERGRMKSRPAPMPRPVDWVLWCARVIWATTVASSSSYRSMFEPFWVSVLNESHSCRVASDLPTVVVSNASSTCFVFAHPNLTRPSSRMYTR